MCVWQACQAYEQFMIDLAKLIRTDRGLEINENVIQQDVARVMALESEIANVSDILFQAYDVRQIWKLSLSLKYVFL